MRRVSVWVGLAWVVVGCSFLEPVPQRPILASPAPNAAPDGTSRPVPGRPHVECAEGQLAVDLEEAVSRPVGGEITIIFTNQGGAACRLALDVPTALVDATGALLLESGPVPPTATGILLDPGGTHAGTVFWENWCADAPTPLVLVVGHGHIEYERVPLANHELAPCVDPLQPPRLQPVI